MAEQKVPHKSFSISEAIRFAWKVATKNFWFFFRFLLLSQVISMLLSYTSSTLQNNHNTAIQIIGLLLVIVGWFINVELSFAKIAIYFNFVDKKKSAVKNLFDYFNFKLLFRFFLIELLLNILVIIGLLLFIYPGIYFLTKYWFAAYIYVDKRTGVIDSFKESAKLTKGIKRKLFLLGILQGLIILAGALAFLVGLFITVPMNTLSDLYVYRKLSSKK